MNESYVNIRTRNRRTTSWMKLQPSCGSCHIWKRVPHMSGVMNIWRQLEKESLSTACLRISSWQLKRSLVISISGQPRYTSYERSHRVITPQMNTCIHLGRENEVLDMQEKCWSKNSSAHWMDYCKNESAILIMCLIPLMGGTSRRCTLIDNGDKWSMRQNTILGWWTQCVWHNPEII